MQTSMVFSQRKWPGAGDVDDCWVVSAIQAVNVTAPWPGCLDMDRDSAAAIIALLDTAS